MNKHITRRDFLNGVAIAITGVATGTLTACGGDKPTNTQNTAGKSSAPTTPTASTNYPPALNGMRGDHEGSYEVAHEMAWKKTQFDVSGEPVHETYDLVVVGAGISGMSAGYFYQKKFPNAKILILDNHDDFGGHAKRNEFHETVDGKDIFRITYGGSESIDTPSDYSDEAIALLKELDIDLEKFYTYYDQSYFEKLGMKEKGVFFNKATFGQSTIVPELPDAQNAQAFFDKAPLDPADKLALSELYTTPKDYLTNIPANERENYLKSISYGKFLEKHVGLSVGAMRYFEEICLEYWGFPADGLSAYDAFYDGHPGFDKAGLESDDEGEGEPYIFHFPDGNASILRLIVKKLIPNVVSNPENSQGKTAMEAIVLDKFDYDKLDVAGQNFNIRLNATAVQAKNIEKEGKKGVMVGYKKGDKLYRVDATHCILACQHGMIPLLDSDLPQTQKTDHQLNVRVPMIYTKVLVKDWTAFKKLGVWKLYSPKAPFVLVMLDYPVSMGGYDYPKDSNEPTVIHMVRIPVPYGTGKDVREACKLGRAEIYGKSFEEIEKQATDQLREIYEQAGESFDDKVLAITVNRWGHGYSYEHNRLFDGADTDKVLENIKRSHGNIHIANSDADWTPYADGAIDQAWRAVSEIQG